MYCKVLNFDYICRMELEKTKAQMRKGVLELCILSIIAEQDAYVSDILERLKKSKMIVVEGTLYPLLARLKNEGYLNYRWEESKSGPPRKYYSLTHDGRIFLEGLTLTWNELSEAVNSTLLANIRS